MSKNKGEESKEQEKRFVLVLNTYYKEKQYKINK